MDERLIKSIGVSVKDSDNAIGYFGTGLKYAISVLLRENCKIRIMTDEKVLEFSLHEEEIRGKTFSFICMNGEKLSFTTEFGKNWNVSNAFRELACNTTDEGGSYRELMPFFDSSRSKPGTTQIVVEGQPFADAWDRKEDILPDLQRLEMVDYGGGVQAYARSSGYLYYKGVQVYELPKPSKYLYNFVGHVTLTEDRTIKSPELAYSSIRGMHAESNSRELIKTIATAADTWLEGTFNYSYISPGDTMQEVCEDLIKKDFLSVNKTLVAVVTRRNPTKFVEKTLLKDYPDARKKIAIYKYLTLLEKQFPGISHKYPIKITPKIAPGVMGLAVDGDIIISEETFEIGAKFVAGTIFEEFMHLETGFEDLTRSFQNSLINRMMTLTERLNDEDF